MKKLLLLLAVLLMTAIGTMAQNANRKGFFLELQGGAAFGEVLKYEQGPRTSNTIPLKSMPKLKGGMVGSFDLGYRWATSSQFAFDAKIGVWTDLADLKNTHLLRLMPGLRWTSNDFGSNNMSAFIAFNAGAGIHICEKAMLGIPMELAVGMNFSQHFYAGFLFNYSLYVNEQRLDIQNIYSNKQYIDISINPKSYPSAGIRLGYRF